MKTKKVNRYWCDFCNKAGLQAGAMRKHEKHCTMNPDRVCRVCVLTADWLEEDALESKKPLDELVAMLPDPGLYNTVKIGPDVFDTHNALVTSCSAIYPSFKRAAGGCPACMMAALRLRKVPIPMMEDFSFKREMVKIFADLDDVPSNEGGY